MTTETPLEPLPRTRRMLAALVTVGTALAIPVMYWLAISVGLSAGDKYFFGALAVMPFGVLPGYGLVGRIERGVGVAIAILVGAAIAAGVSAVVAIFVIGAWGLTLAAMVLYPVMVFFAAVWAAFDVATAPARRPR